MGKRIEATEEMGEGALWNIIRNGDEDELERRMRRGIQIKQTKESKATGIKSKSEFCKDDKCLKNNIGMDKY